MAIYVVNVKIKKDGGRVENLKRVITADNKGDALAKASEGVKGRPYISDHFAGLEVDPAEVWA